MIDFDFQLANDNITLRPVQAEDYHSFLELATPKELWIYFTNDLSIPKVLEVWVKEALFSRTQSKRLAFAVVENRSHTTIGSTSFGNFSSRDRRLEVGWTWLGENYQGKGFNLHMKYLMLEYAFESLAMERVECKTDVLNKAARKALLKAGFTQEGILRSHTLMSHERRRDTIYYSVLKQEWPRVKEKLLSLL